MNDAFLEFEINDPIKEAKLWKKRVKDGENFNKGTIFSIFLF